MPYWLANVKPAPLREAALPPAENRGRAARQLRNEGTKSADGAATFNNALRVELAEELYEDAGQGASAPPTQPTPPIPFFFKSEAHATITSRLL